MRSPLPRVQDSQATPIPSARYFALSSTLRTDDTPSVVRSQRSANAVMHFGFDRIPQQPDLMTMSLIAFTASSPTSLRHLARHARTAPVEPPRPTGFIVRNRAVPTNHMTRESSAPPDHRAHPHNLLIGTTLTPLRGPAPDLAPSSVDCPRCTFTHPLIDYHRNYYRTESPTTTRETSRSPLLHQFVQADTARPNLFDPSRPANRPTAHYSVTQPAHDVAPCYPARRTESRYLRATANLVRAATVRSPHTRHHTFHHDAHRILRLRRSR